MASGSWRQSDRGRGSYRFRHYHNRNRNGAFNDEQSKNSYDTNYDEKSNSSYKVNFKQSRRGQSYRKSYGDRRNQWDNTSDATTSVHKERTPSMKHPPGLRGREIGLWHARQHKKNNEIALNTAPSFTMGSQDAKDLNEALNSLKKDEDSHSYFQNRLKNADSERCNNLTDSERNDVVKNKEAKPFSSYCKLPLKKNSILDETFYEELKEKMSTKGYKEMLQIRQKLPTYDMKDEIIDAISNNQVIVLSGETGCGKTTQVCQFILDDLIMKKEGSTCHIICTQPRRLSTLAVSQRVADERNESLGKSVGFQIRLESVSSRPSGSVIFCTTGIVLQCLISDPTLSSASHIVLDEIHERNTDSDFLISIIKDLLLIRPELKVILMSATLNADKFSKFFDECPMLHIPGVTFDVEEHYLEDVLQLTNFKYSQNMSRKFSDKKAIDDFYEMIGPYARELEVNQSYSRSVIRELHRPESEELNLELILELLYHISGKSPGAVLIFVPGWSAISKLNRLIEEHGHFNSNDYLIIPLHSLMPTTNQRQVFEKTPEGVRKVVIATSIAETSITINDVVYVIDCGKTNMQNYDKNTNIKTLAPQWVTIANAKQRKGRAGRVQNGVCFHLYSRAREMLLDQYPLPEIQRTRLEEVILKIKILKLGPCKTFLMNLMDAPDEVVIDVSVNMLKSINALDEDEVLTPLGVHLARLPMDPLIGKMLLMSTIFSCVDPILTVAASLSFKDPFVFSLGQEKAVDNVRKEFSEGYQSDHLMLVNVYNEWEESQRFKNDRHFLRKNFLSLSVLNQIQNLRRQLAGLLHENNFIDTRNSKAKSINHNSSNANLVKAVITAGLYPNVARIMKKHYGDLTKSIQLPGRQKAHIHRKSVNEKERRLDGDWIVYWEKMKTANTYLFDTTAVSIYPLLLFGQNFNYNEEEGVVYVDDFVKCSCSREVAMVMKKLRKQLNELLELRISNPKTTDWANSTREKQFLSIVVDTLNENKYEAM